MTTDQPRAWTEIEPKDAVGIDLSKRLDITAPLNENGERCPWPWEPQQLGGAPMGQYRCGYCGAMCMADLPHFDYTPEERTLTAENFDEVAEWCGGGPSVSDHRVLLIGGTDDIGEARYGDVIHRDGFGEFTIRPAAPCARCKGSGVDPECTATEDYGDVIREVATPCSACQLDAEVTS